MPLRYVTGSSTHNMTSAGSLAYRCRVSGPVTSFVFCFNIRATYYQNIYLFENFLRGRYVSILLMLCFRQLFAKYNYNHKVEEDEVGGTCGTNGGEEERV
jgi:hypothetical protein